MSSSTPSAPVHCYPRADGVDVVPFVLPMHVPAEAYEMTVAEWLGLPGRSA